MQQHEFTPAPAVPRNKLPNRSKSPLPVESRMKRRCAGTGSLSTSQSTLAGQIAHPPRWSSSSHHWPAVSPFTLAAI
jgi:hypothetical protein